MSKARYAIGIDLGTTNSALSYVDLDQSDGEETVQELLPIPQLTAPGAVEQRPVLPSFLYLPHPEELSAADLRLPWNSPGGRIGGELARQIGTNTPIRLVSSAKSWLCHPQVDRRSPILPAGAPEEVPKVSPLEATACYLRHLRAAWDSAQPEHPFDQQQVTVTVPASFDPAARELTVEAARAVGIEKLLLLEEPQAALYSWVGDSRGEWRDQVRLGDVILVVDVGGGTTDLSLIAVTEQEGALQLTRVAVGEHILLGGDNMDLALAHVVTAKLASRGIELDNWQTQALTHACRGAKEQLMAAGEQDSVPISVPSRSSRLIGGTIRTDLTREEVWTTVVQGFFPEVPSSARPTGRHRSALTKLGLPFAQDAALTRHLAAFLGRQIGATEDLGSLFPPPGEASFLHPTAVLFNGGVFKAQVLQDRVLQVIDGWLAADGAATVRRLAATDLDLAVAKGAAYHAYMRQAGGVRIRGGTAQAYYVGVEGSMPAVPGVEPPIQALCLAPFGMEEGSEPVAAPQEFGLVVGEPVRFRFFGSSVRREDQAGMLLAEWPADEIEELEDIQATLPAESRRAGDVVPVRLAAAITEVGTLELEAIPISGSENWKVEFNFRASGQETA